MLPSYCSYDVTSCDCNNNIILSIRGIIAMDRARAHLIGHISRFEAHKCEVVLQTSINMILILKFNWYSNSNGIMANEIINKLKTLFYNVICTFFTNQ